MYYNTHIVVKIMVYSCPIHVLRETGFQITSTNVIFSFLFNFSKRYSFMRAAIIITLRLLWLVLNSVQRLLL